jgi:hypothetical protein
MSIASRPPSRRHQSFAAGAVFPGEDPEEFKALYQQLCGDLRPVGRLEISLVVDIATYQWRKDRLNTFHEAERARRELGEFFADGDLEVGLRSVWLHREQQQLHRAECLLKSHELAEQLKQQLRNDDPNFDEIPKHFNMKPETARTAAAKAFERDEAKDRTETQLAALGDVITPECFLQELEFRQRLDAAIERSLDLLIKYQARRISALPVSRRTRERRVGRHLAF